MLNKLFFDSKLYVAFVITMFSAFFQLVFSVSFDLNILLFTFLCSWFYYGSNTLNIGDWKKNTVKIVFLSGCLISIFYLTFVIKFTLLVWFILTFLALLSVMYSLVLRSIPFLKSFVIALVISGFVVSVNFYQLPNEVSLFLYVILFSMAYFYLLGVAILFDLGDINYDSQKNLKTFANSMSQKTMKSIVGAFFSISFCCLLMAKNHLNPTLFFAFGFSLLWSFIFLLLIHKNSKSFYFFFILETCLALPLLIFILLTL